MKTPSCANNSACWLNPSIPLPQREYNLIGLISIINWLDWIDLIYMIGLIHVICLTGINAMIEVIDDILRCGLHSPLYPRIVFVIFKIWDTEDHVGYIS